MLCMSPSLQRQIGKRKPFGTPEEEAFMNLLRTAWAVSGSVNRVYSDYDLTASQYSVLRILRGHRPEALSCGEGLMHNGDCPGGREESRRLV